VGPVWNLPLERKGSKRMDKQNGAGIIQVGSGAISFEGMDVKADNGNVYIRLRMNKSHYIIPMSPDMAGKVALALTDAVKFIKAGQDKVITPHKDFKL